jgi:hypothetical protein
MKIGRKAGIWSSRMKQRDVPSSADVKGLSTEELELREAAREMRAQKQQREAMRAQLSKILASAEQKPASAPVTVAQTAVELLAAAREAAKPTPIKRVAPLRRPRVVIRVRPLAESGGHSNAGEAVSKRLASWENGTVVLEEHVGIENGSITGKRSQSYSYAHAVIRPDAKQAEVHKESAAGLVTAVCSGGYNGLLFAYGQTGTGKTHTIFGPEASWGSIHHQDAGLLPRALAAILERINATASTTSAVLTASAVEFYMHTCVDLLGASDGAPCLIGADHTPLGLTRQNIESEQNCLSFMAQVRHRRHTRATLMNAAKGAHEGSSRSHCAMILTLRQLDRASGDVLTTALHIIDMAGAERPSKVESTQLAMWDAEDGNEPSIASQGMIINFELSQLRTAVVQATEQHQKGLPLINPKAAGTEFIEYTKGCFDGSSLLSMIVTLSPARSCGWETWFSCTYGEDLQKLRCPVQPQKARSLSKLIVETERSIQRATQDLETREDVATKAGHRDRVTRHLNRRSAQLQHDKDSLEELRRLAALGERGKTSTNDGACVIS